MKYLRYVTILGILLVVLAGCGDGDSDEGPVAYSLYSDSSEDSAMPMNMVAGTPSWTGGDSTTGQDSAQTIEPMIIKSGSLSLTVEDTDAAITQITGIAAEYGGYVIRSNSNHTGSYNTGGITLAVRAEQFEAAMSALQTVGLEVMSVSTTGEDVTAEYVDLESRLHNLEATRDRLLTFLNDAQSAEEAILVNDRLTAIEGDIEQVKGRMNYLSGRATFSTVTVNLREPDAPDGDDSDGWSLSSTIDHAISAQGELVQVVAKGVIWLAIVAGPYVVIAGGVVVGWRRWFKSPPREETPPAE